MHRAPYRLVYDHSIVRQFKPVSKKESWTLHDSKEKARRAARTTQEFRRNHGNWMSYRVYIIHVYRKEVA